MEVLLIMGAFVLGYRLRSTEVTRSENCSYRQGCDDTSKTMANMMVKMNVESLNNLLLHIGYKADCQQELDIKDNAIVISTKIDRRYPKLEGKF